MHWSYVFLALTHQHILGTNKSTLLFQRSVIYCFLPIYSVFVPGKIFITPSSLCLPMKKWSIMQILYLELLHGYSPGLLAEPGTIQTGCLFGIQPAASWVQAKYTGSFLQKISAALCFKGLDVRFISGLSDCINYGYHIVYMKICILITLWFVYMKICILITLWFVYMKISILISLCFL